MPDNTQFILRLSEVTSVLAKVWASWPGELNLNGIDNEQRSQIIDEYNKKGRTESITWSDFETNVIEYSCDILNADLVVNDSSVIFSFMGLCDDTYYDAKVSAGQISVSYNGINATIEEFISLGDAYWTAFANRRNQRDLP